MSFFTRFKSKPYDVVVRRAPGDILVGRRLSVEIDFQCENLNEDGDVLPQKAYGTVEKLCDAMFDNKLLVDNQDPHADNLMKLKRIGAADPMLFDTGTSGPQMAFHIGRSVEEWLGTQRWNPPADDVLHVSVALCTIRLGRDEFFYDLA